MDTEYDRICKKMDEIQNKMHKIKNGPVVWSAATEEEFYYLSRLYSQLYDQLMAIRHG